jgi:hypothetical protein
MILVAAVAVTMVALAVAVAAAEVVAVVVDDVFYFIQGQHFVHLQYNCNHNTRKTAQTIHHHAYHIYSSISVSFIHGLILHCCQSKSHEPLKRFYTHLPPLQWLICS